MCVRVRAMLDLGDGDEAGTGSHKAYMMAARWCGFRASAQGVVWPGARCQVGERRQRAEGEQRQAERVQPRCSAGPGVASVGLACRNRRSRQVARRDDRWLPFPRRLDKDKDGQESNPCPPPVLSAYGIWLEPPLFLSDGPDCLAPHSPVLRGERGGRSSNIGRAEAPTR